MYIRKVLIFFIVHHFSLYKICNNNEPFGRNYTENTINSKYLTKLIRNYLFENKQFQSPF